MKSTWKQRTKNQTVWKASLTKNTRCSRRSKTEMIMALHCMERRKCSSHCECRFTHIVVGLRWRAATAWGTVAYIRSRTASTVCGWSSKHIPIWPLVLGRNSALNAILYGDFMQGFFTRRRKGIIEGLQIEEITDILGALPNEIAFILSSVWLPLLSS